jgi:hypothetical protein
MQPVSRQGISKHILAATNTNTTIELPFETVFSTRSVQSGYKEDNWSDPVSCQCSEGSQLVKRRLGGWCEMAANLAVVSWELSSAWEAVKIESEPINWRISNVRSRLPGNGWWRHSRLKKLSGRCGDLRIVWFSDIAVITCSSEWCV